MTATVRSRTNEAIARQRFDLKAWTGPTDVRAVAQKLQEAGVVDAWAGTERVYCVAFGLDHYDAVDRTKAALVRVHGTTFGLEFVVHGADYWRHAR